MNQLKKVTRDLSMDIEKLGLFIESQPKEFLFTDSHNEMTKLIINLTLYRQMIVGYVVKNSVK